MQVCEFMSVCTYVCMSTFVPMYKHVCVCSTVAINRKKSTNRKATNLVCTLQCHLKDLPKLQPAEEIDFIAFCDMEKLIGRKKEINHT